MKVLLFGKNGQVGWELNRSLLPLGEVIALGRDDADFSRPESLRGVIRQINPDVIINAAAYTAVDRAEEEEEDATLINGVAPGVIAEEAKNLKALLVHYSTDYVFDGMKEDGYIEDDFTNPINAYGRSKLEGERNIEKSGCDYLIFRASWVYSSRGHNFLLTVLRLVKENEYLDIINDQFGSPTWARLIADVTTHCIRRSVNDIKENKFKSDLYHLSSSGSTSWYGFSEAIIKTACNSLDTSLASKQVRPISTSEYVTLAERPSNTNLISVKLENKFSIVLPKWDSVLELCIRELV